MCPLPLSSHELATLSLFSVHRAEEVRCSLSNERPDLPDMANESMMQGLTSLPVIDALLPKND